MDVLLPQLRRGDVHLERRQHLAALVVLYRKTLMSLKKRRDRFHLEGVRQEGDLLPMALMLS
jgi:hypothetical protein